jgi:serine phosphatase RsbU (regulator of sigma subunit)
MDLVEPWMKELARITGADWHAFFVLAPDGECLVKATGDGIAIPDAIQLPKGGVEIPQMCTASRSVMTRQDVWFDSQMVFHPQDAMRVVCAGTSGLLHSVFQGATLVGLAALGRRVDEDPFTAGQVNVIHTFADFLGTQIRHAQAQQDVIENRVLRRDLEIAAGIQHSLLPAVLPHAPGLDIFGSSTSAQEVGGDFYDVIGLPGGSVLIVIADVMGKGVPAALFTAILRALVRSRRDIARHPEALLEWIASTLFADLDRVEMFATMQLAYFDARSSTVKVSGAGHCPLLVATSDGKVQSIHSEGLPIGIKNVSDYESLVVPLVPGSRLVLYTDGVTDVRNAAGEEWGMENLNDWLARSDSASASALGESLLREIADYRGGTVAPDDITFVVITTLS